MILHTKPAISGPRRAAAGQLRAMVVAAGLLSALPCALAMASEADDAVLAACRANPDLADIPRAADLGCACAVDAMAQLDDDQKRAVADAGFVPAAFDRLAENHPNLLESVRACLEPDEQ